MSKEENYFGIEQYIKIYTLHYYFQITWQGWFKYSAILLDNRYKWNPEQTIAYIHQDQQQIISLGCSLTV